MGKPPETRPCRPFELASSEMFFHDVLDHTARLVGASVVYFNFQKVYMHTYTHTRTYTYAYTLLTQLRLWRIEPIPSSYCVIIATRSIRYAPSDF